MIRHIKFFSTSAFGNLMEHLIKMSFSTRKIFKFQCFDSSMYCLVDYLLCDPNRGTTFRGWTLSRQKTWRLSESENNSYRHRICFCVDFLIVD